MELLPVTDTLVAVLYADPHCYRVGEVAEIRRRESRNQVAVMPRNPRITRSVLLASLAYSTHY